MRLILALTVPLAVFAGGVPESIVGRYTKAPGDSLRITSQKDGKAKVETRLVFGGGQVCMLEGEAEWKDNVLALQADGLEDGKPCRLEMRFTGSKVTLTDVQDRCRPVYCGTAGTFQGATLTKPTPPAKAPAPKAPPAKGAAKSAATHK